MKHSTCNSFNLKKGSSISTIGSLISHLKICKEVNQYCFYLHGNVSFYHFKKNKYIILFFINIPIFLKKDLRLIHNLSKFNKKLRDVMTKKNM